MISNIIKYFREVATLVSDIKHVSISQWDVENDLHQVKTANEHDNLQ
jgi:hypothetical protein